MIKHGKLLIILFFTLSLIPLLLGGFTFLPKTLDSFRNVHILFLFFFILLFFLKTHRQWFKSLIHTPETLLDNSQEKKLFAILCAFSFIAFTKSCLLNYYAFNVSGIDFSIFDWMIPMTERGQFMTSPIINLKNHFAIHSSPIFFLLYPFHRIINDPIFFIVLHGIVLWSSVFPLRKILLLNKVPAIYAFLTVLSFLCFQSTHQILMYQFHMEVFYVPLFLWFYYFTQKNKLIYSWLMVLLIWSIKEDGALITAFGSIAYFFGKNKKPKFAMSLFVLSAVFFFINVKVYMPSQSQNIDAYILSPASPYKYGKTLSEVLLGVLTHPISVLIDVTKGGWAHFALMFLFLPFHLSFVFLSSIPAILIHSISSREVIQDMGLYYSATLLPFLYIGYTTVLQKITKTKKQKPRLHSILKISFIIVFFLTIFNGTGYLRYPKIKNRNTNFQVVFNKVNLDQPMCVQNHIFPHIGYPQKALPLKQSCIDNKTNQIILNADINSYPYSNKKINQWIQTLKKENHYKTYQSGSFYLFQR